MTNVAQRLIVVIAAGAGGWWGYRIAGLLGAAISAGVWAFIASVVVAAAPPPDEDEGG